MSRYWALALALRCCKFVVELLWACPLVEFGPYKTRSVWMCWELTTLYQRYQQPVLRDISWMLKWCRTKTTQQSLNPRLSVQCQSRRTCMSDLELMVPAGNKSAPMAHCNCVDADAHCRLPFEVEQIKGTRSYWAISNGRDLCEVVPPAYRSTRPRCGIARSSIYVIPSSGARY